MTPTPSVDREKFVLRALVVLGIVLVTLFGFRAAKSAVRVARHGLAPHNATEESIRGWMTVPYVAEAFGVPEAYLFERLGVPAEQYRKRSIASIDRELAGNERGRVMNLVRTAVGEYLKAHPAGPDTPP